MRHVTLRRLRTFAEVAERRSFARAAEALHLTQPAVSMQVRELEGSVGLPVFERTGKHARLTLAGEHLLVYARRIFATLKEAEDAIARLRGLKGGRIVIGMVSTAEQFLPRLLARFRARHPAIELRLSVANRDQLLRSLADHEVDLAVMGRPPEALALRAIAFAANPLAVLASPQHPLARRRALRPAALAREPFIVRETGSGTRAVMEEFFHAHHIAPPIIMEMTGNETIKQAVMADMGLAFLSLHTAAAELRERKLRRLDVKGLPVVRRWHLVSVEAKPLSPAAEAFREFVLREGADILEALLHP